MARAGLILAGLLAAAPAMADCRQALAIGLDVSGSVDSAEYALQRNGMLAALLNDDVRQAILQMPEAPLSMMIYEWSGTGSQRILVPWQSIGDEAGLDAFALDLESALWLPSSPATAIGDAMLFGLDQLAERADCWTLTLDLAGDGRSNVGPRPSAVLTRAEGKQVTVNALVVAVPEGHGGDPGVAELSAYFIAEVIRGPGAFAEVALGYQDFAQAMARKLLREMEGITVGERSGKDQAAPPVRLRISAADR